MRVVKLPVLGDENASTFKLFPGCHAARVTSQVVAEGLRNGVIVNKKIADHNAQTLTTEGSRTLRDVFAALAVIEPSEADREGMRDK